jgi:hypothetical protein
MAEAIPVPQMSVILAHALRLFLSSPGRGFKPTAQCRGRESGSRHRQHLRNLEDYGMTKEQESNLRCCQTALWKITPNTWTIRRRHALCSQEFV